jgi:hypothetical protein
MTQDEIVEMARQAGCPDVYTEWAKFDWSSIKGLIVPMTLEQLVHCAKLVAAKEREACAEIAEKQRYAMFISLTSHPAQNGTAVGIANTIRARGEA